MKTLLISGATRIPDPLREIVERGSTILERRRAREVDSAALSKAAADRVVFWQSPGEDEVAKLASAFANRDARDAPMAIVFVTAGAAAPPASLAQDQVFVWPRDEDRLKMAFMTGA
jgi:hypothetical protein